MLLFLYVHVVQILSKMKDNEEFYSETTFDKVVEKIILMDDC